MTDTYEVTGRDEVTRKWVTLYSRDASKAKAEDNAIASFEAARRRMALGLATFDDLRLMRGTKPLARSRIKAA